MSTSLEDFRLVVKYGQVREKMSVEMREKRRQDAELIKRYREDSSALDPDAIEKAHAQWNENGHECQQANSELINNYHEDSSSSVYLSSC